MKRAGLGDFEETLLLIVGILGYEAYALNVADEFEEQTKRVTSIGAVHSTLNRLSKKGFLTSKVGDPTPERGGRRKRIYEITAEGYRALEQSKELKISLWSQFPAFPDFKLKIN